MVKNNGIDSSNPVLQIVTSTLKTELTCTTVLPMDDTIPQNTEGDQVLTVTITPISATSLLEIFFTAGNIAPSGTPAASIALFQDSTANALIAKSLTGALAKSMQYSMQYFMTSGTTSATTFKIRCGPASAASIYINGDSVGTQLYGGVAQTILKVIEYNQ